MNTRLLLLLLALLCGPAGCVTKQALDTFSFVPCSCRTTMEQGDSLEQQVGATASDDADATEHGKTGRQPRYVKGREERFAIWAAPILPITLAMDLVTLPFQAFAFGMAIYLIAGGGSA